MPSPYSPGYEGIMEWLDAQPQWLRIALNEYGPDAFFTLAKVQREHPNVDLERVWKGAIEPALRAQHAGPPSQEF